MTISPLAFAESLHVGIVDFVSPDEIKVLLDIEAPDSMAMNTGMPRPFPRINSYVLIPGDQGYLVGQVEWITIERSQYPKRKGMQDFGLVDLPYPLRKMSLNPLGNLNYDDKQGDRRGYLFKRGVESYPAVGDAVLLPTQNQLRAIIESGEKRRVKIGISPMAANAEVKIDPDRLFGRHLAVLGNTGSGKSCSVAGLIRWSLEEARKTRNGADPNARFIILDPNGEYANTFLDMNNTRVFTVEPEKNTNINQLQVPIWFWNSVEWSAFTRASDKAQRPLLRRALREMRIGSSFEEDMIFILRRKISSILITLQSQVRNGANYEGWKFGPKLPAFIADLDEYSRQFPEQSEGLVYLKNKVVELHDKHIKENIGQTIRYKDFPSTAVDAVLGLFNRYLKSIGGIIYQSGPDENAPLPFDGAQFADHLESLANQENNSQYFDYLVMRIRNMLSDTRIKKIATGTESISLHNWLENYIGSDKASNGAITVIDLSLMPAEIIYIITAVISRIILESLQRYRRLYSDILPTVLVMEEAHTFIKHYMDNTEDQNSVAACCQVFEKIAREGRKFGLGLILSSQRPSELSPTVLSQCNTFLLHRISNDRDQELISKLVPDNLRGILRDLPTLPSRHAILLGWASELPVLVQINALPDNQRPQSDDPDFWAVWSGEGLKIDEEGKPIERAVDWKKIVDDWQQISATGIKDEINAEKDKNSTPDR
jgi:hypothetical protein